MNYVQVIQAEYFNHFGIFTLQKKKKKMPVMRHEQLLTGPFTHQIDVVVGLFSHGNNEQRVYL